MMSETIRTGSLQMFDLMIRFARVGRNLPASMIKECVNEALTQPRAIRKLVINHLFEILTPKEIGDLLSVAVADNNHRIVRLVAMQRMKSLQAEGFFHSRPQPSFKREVYAAVEFALYNEMVPDRSMIDLLVALRSDEQSVRRAGFDGYFADRPIPDQVGVALSWAIFVNQIHPDLEQLSIFLRKTQPDGCLNPDLVMLVLKQSRRVDQHSRIVALLRPEEIQRVFRPLMRENHADLVEALIKTSCIQRDHLLDALVDARAANQQPIAELIQRQVGALNLEMIQRMALRLLESFERQPFFQPSLQQFPRQQILAAIEFALSNDIFPEPSFVSWLMVLSSETVLQRQEGVDRYLASAPRPQEAIISIRWALLRHQVGRDIERIINYLRHEGGRLGRSLHPNLVSLLLNEAQHAGQVLAFLRYLLPEEIQIAIRDSTQQNNANLVEALLQSPRIQREDMISVLVDARASGHLNIAQLIQLRLNRPRENNNSLIYYFVVSMIIIAILNRLFMKGPSPH
jgi:hypothetical protein